MFYVKNELCTTGGEEKNVNSSFSKVGQAALDLKTCLQPSTQTRKSIACHGWAVLRPCFGGVGSA